MLRSFFPAIGLGLTLTSLIAGAAPTANPGQFEVTTSMTMNGPQGTMNMPATTTKVCIKPEDAGNFQKHFSSGPRGQNKDCSVIDQSASGDTVTFHLKCEGKTPSEVKGTVTYASDGYKGHTDIDATTPRGEMHMSNDFSAKRVGGC